MDYFILSRLSFIIAIIITTLLLSKATIDVKAEASSKIIQT